MNKEIQEKIFSVIKQQESECRKSKLGLVQNSHDAKYQSRKLETFKKNFDKILQLCEIFPDFVKNFQENSPRVQKINKALFEKHLNEIKSFSLKLKPEHQTSVNKILTFFNKKHNYKNIPTDKLQDLKTYFQDQLDKKQSIKLLEIIKRFKMQGRDFLIVGELGRGDYGVVFLIADLVDLSFFCAKAIDAAQIKRGNISMRSVTQSELCLSEIQRDCLLTHLEHIGSKRHQIHIIEFFPGITIEKFMPQILSWDLSRKLYLLFWILEGITEIHKLGFAHGDLSPRNMMIDPISHLIKIIDYGCVTRDTEKQKEDMKRFYDELADVVLNKLEDVKSFPELYELFENKISVAQEAYNILSTLLLREYSASIARSKGLKEEFIELASFVCDISKNNNRLYKFIIDAEGSCAEIYIHKGLVKKANYRNLTGQKALRAFLMNSVESMKYITLDDVAPEKISSDMQDFHQYKLYELALNVGRCNDEKQREFQGIFKKYHYLEESDQIIFTKHGKEREWQDVLNHLVITHGSRLGDIDFFERSEFENVEHEKNDRGESFYPQGVTPVCQFFLKLARDHRDTYLTVFNKPKGVQAKDWEYTIDQIKKTFCMKENFHSQRIQFSQRMKVAKNTEGILNAYVEIPYSPNVSFFQLMKRARGQKKLLDNIDISVRKKIMLELAYALEGVHSANLIHRNLNPFSTFLRADGQIELGDFYLACESNFEPSKHTNTLSKSLSESIKNTEENLSWIPVWINFSAPEILNNCVDPISGLTKACDIWSFAVLCINFCCGKNPFSGSIVEKISAIKEGRWDKSIISHKLSDIKDILIQSLNVDPQERPNIRDIIEEFEKSRYLFSFKDTYRKNLVDNTDDIIPKVEENLKAHFRDDLLKKYSLPEFLFSFPQEKIDSDFFKNFDSESNTELQKIFEEHGTPIADITVEPKDVSWEIKSTKDGNSHYFTLSAKEDKWFVYYSQKNFYENILPKIQEQTTKLNQKIIAEDNQWVLHNENCDRTYFIKRENSLLNFFEKTSD